MSTISYYRSPQLKEEIQAVYTAVLEEWPRPNRQLRIPTRHGETFVVASGRTDGTAMILLHGSGSSSYMWAGDAERYGKQFRLYAVDIPGEAGRSAEYRADWKGNDFVEWLEDLYAGLGIEKAVLVGISLGGWIATRFAIERSAKVSGLVLLCASGFRPPRISFLFRVIILSLLGSYGMKRLEELIFNSSDIDPRVSAYFRLMTRGFRPRQGVPPLFSDGQLARLSMRLLYLGGDQDMLIDTRGSIERIRRVLPQAESRLLPDKGHALTGVADSLLEFLDPLTNQPGGKNSRLLPLDGVYPAAEAG